MSTGSPSKSTTLVYTGTWASSRFWCLLRAQCRSWTQDNAPQIRWLKQKKHIISEFWRLEVCNQGAGNSSAFWGFSPWLVDGPVSHIVFSMWCMSVYFYQVASHSGLVPTLMTSTGLPKQCSGIESICRKCKMGSIPGLGRSPGERNGNPL